MPPADTTPMQAMSETQGTWESPTLRLKRLAISFQILSHPVPRGILSPGEPRVNYGDVPLRMLSRMFVTGWESPPLPFNITGAPVVGTAIARCRTGLLAGAILVGYQAEMDRRILWLIFSHESWPELCAGDAIPPLEVIFEQEFIPDLTLVGGADGPAREVTGEDMTP